MASIQRLLWSPDTDVQPLFSLKARWEHYAILQQPLIMMPSM